MKRRVFVIGGAGFLGRVVCRELHRTHEIVVCDSAKRLGNKETLGFNSLEYDFGVDPPQRIACERGDVAVIFSWRGYPAAHEQDPVGTLSLNVNHTLKLVRWLVDRGISEVIYASSGGAVYGNCGPEPVREDGPLNPVGFYGVGKLTAEMYVRKVLGEAGARYIILRIGNAYGPGQIADNLSVGLIAKAVLAARTGIPLEVWGKGENLRDYIHVEDVATAVRAVVDTPDLPAGAYNVGSGTAVTNREVIALVGRTLGVTVPLVQRDARGFDVGGICLNTDAIRLGTRWAPTWTIRQGILQMDRILNSQTK
jgi:UDP-glucose 4-epimerase